MILFAPNSLDYPAILKVLTESIRVSLSLTHPFIVITHIHMYVCDAHVVNDNP
jgi:hypothetical protein